MVVAWWLTMFLVVCFGAVYPGRALTPANRVAGGDRSSGRPDGLYHDIRRKRWAACLTSARRYYGVALGLGLCAVCFWVICHRLLFFVYPWELNLLTTGLVGDEVEVVRSVLSALQ